MAASGVKRRANELRAMRITRGFTDCAAGSVLMEMGQTRVLCTASIANELPRWRKESGLGWVTAEYNMLPSSTSPRKPRSKIGYTDGRGTEIGRIVGRVIRSVLDFAKLGENTITLDCEVLQADGGTRTAAINGSWVALYDAIRFGLKQGFLQENPLTGAVAAISMGKVAGRVVIDLDYEMDSRAEVDLTVAMTDQGEMVEIQGTGEKRSFSEEELIKMLRLGRSGTGQILALQQRSLRRRVVRI